MYNNSIDMLEQKFVNLIKAYLPQIKDKKLLIAVSGGADSVCLLDIFVQVREQYHLDLFVAHFNHMLRGEDSDRDAVFVKELCEKYNIPVFIATFDVAAFAKENKYSLEEAARIKRYNFFSEVAEYTSVRTIVSGHHADDQVETVLQRFLGGASVDALAGMDLLRPLFCNPELLVFRPFLSSWRWEIMDYLAKNNLQFRFDESNLNYKYSRNKIRNELIPMLTKNYNPAIKDSITNILTMIKEDADFFRKEIDRYQPEIKTGPDYLAIDVTTLSSHPALRKRLLLKLFRESSLPPETLSFQTLCKLDELLSKNKASFLINLKNDFLLKKSQNWLSVEPVNADDHFFSVPAPGLGIVTLPEINKQISLQLVSQDDYKPAGNNPVFLDADKVVFPLTIRSRKSGDTFYPLGSQTSKKIKNYFIDKKVDRFARWQVPLFIDNRGNILFVGNYHIDDRYKVTAVTKKILKIYIRDLMCYTEK
ncbi:MAG TPA: tRNA lysidine(34) synthetase TilS [Candidatus Margulisbacteria bacterium]|nr:tRNA lysidine(34) synthetase TilS [Candidatus Margulisiibacteriota bacterium]